MEGLLLGAGCGIMSNERNTTTNLMSHLYRRSYALSPELVARIQSLSVLLSDQGLALSDGAIVRMALDKGLPIIEKILRAPLTLAGGGDLLQEQNNDPGGMGGPRAMVGGEEGDV